VPIADPHGTGKPAWDCVIINDAGEPDIAGHFFTSAWCYEDQIIQDA
jgi:hypothetical protein